MGRGWRIKWGERESEEKEKCESAAEKEDTSWTKKKDKEALLALI
jgi:hypothetical protein